MCFTAYVIIFFLGAIFGSFGGVIIERAKGGFARSEWKKILGGRSYCPGCNGKTLVRRQLIPLIGWLIQKGKCFRCKSKIPGWYCIIETIMGLVFVVTVWVLVGSIGFESLISTDWLLVLFWVLVNRLLVLIIIADLMYYELNVYAWIILIVIQLLYLSLLGVSFLSSGVIGSIVMAALFYMLYVGAKRYATKKFGEPAEGIGEGDVLMAISIGLFTPFVFNVITGMSGIIAIQTVLIYLILSSLLGMIYRVVRRAFTGENNPHMPFLPAMIIALWIMVLWGGNIVGLLGG